MIIQWTFSLEFIEHNTQEAQRNKKKRNKKAKKIINSSILHQIFDFWRNCFLIPPFLLLLKFLCVAQFFFVCEKPKPRRFKNSIETNIARRGAPRQIFISCTHVCAVSYIVVCLHTIIQARMIIHIGNGKMCSSWHWIGSSWALPFKMLMLQKYSQIYILTYLMLVAVYECNSSWNFLCI